MTWWSSWSMGITTVRLRTHSMPKVRAKVTRVMRVPGSLGRQPHLT